CATAPLASGDPTRTTYTAAAGAPSLAYGPGGFVVAQGNTVQALTSSGAANGAAVNFGSAPPAGYDTRIVARASGYALAIARSGAGPQLFRLDSQLQGAAPPVALSTTTTGQVAL